MTTGDGRSRGGIAGSPRLRALAGLSCAAGLALLLTRAGLRAVDTWSCRWFVPQPRCSATGASCVLVLGHADAGRSASLRNRQRVRAAVGLLRDGDTLITSGGAVAGPVSEARLLAEAAGGLGWDGPVLLEEDSRSTWENIAFSAALMERFDRIVVVSEPLHAAKARRFLQRQNCALAARLVAAPLEARVPTRSWRTAMGLIDLGLSECLPRWAQDPAQGVEGLRRLVRLLPRRGPQSSRG